MRFRSASILTIRPSRFRGLRRKSESIFVVGRKPLQSLKYGKLGSFLKRGLARENLILALLHCTYIMLHCTLSGLVVFAEKKSALELPSCAYIMPSLLLQLS